MAEDFDIIEPLTTRLRGLLKEYPPGLNILKELLQNADDAEATTIIYALDTNTYPIEHLVDPSLAEFQGSALLVYNTSIFSEKDFASLRRLGDSQKAKDKIATGKFGLGFSSIYGWTDSPAILTGKYFVALSPHMSLLTKPKNTGLRIDFTLHSSWMRDQLSAFGTFIDDFSVPFPGTIIRIPLRTEAQSQTSKINNLVLTPDRLIEDLKRFQKDVVDSLPFLKHIENIEIRSEGLLIGAIRIINVLDVREHRLSLKRAIAEDKSFSVSFHMRINHLCQDGKSSICLNKHYYVLHQIARMRSWEDSGEFSTWMEKERLFPWIALAAPLHPQTSEAPCGRVFVTLPLPLMVESTRVNIHGAFALSRDRRSLWSMMDVQNGGSMKEVQWNNFLINKLLPLAWENILAELALHGSLSYDYFPLIHSSQCNLFGTLAKDVILQIAHTDACVWHSGEKSFLPLSIAYLVTDSLPEQLLSALQEVSMPILNGVPSLFRELIRQYRLPHNVLNPSAVRKWLHGHQLKSRDKAFTMALLRYVMSDRAYTDLVGLPLFFCKDEQYRSLTRRVENFPEKFNESLYIMPSDFCGLLDDMKCHILDLETFDDDLREQIQKDILMFSNTNLKSFTMHYFKLYARDILFARHDPRQVEVKMQDCNLNYEWIKDLWKWIDLNWRIDNGTSLDDLWLIPLQDRQTLRKIYCPAAPILIPRGPGANMIKEIYSLTESFPMAADDLEAPISGYLSHNKHIVDTTDLRSFVTWITPNVVEKLPNEIRDCIRHYLWSQIVSTSNLLGDLEKESLLRLSIFKNTSVDKLKDQPALRILYTSLSQPIQVVIVRDLNILPMIDDVMFIDATDLRDEQFLLTLGFSPMPLKSLIAEIILPRLQYQPTWLLDSLIQLIFNNYHLIGSDAIFFQKLSSLSFVSVASRNDEQSCIRLKPAQVINISSRIADLFFNDEKRFGHGIYAQDGPFHTQLIALGMKINFDEEVAEDRIRHFAELSPDNDLFIKYSLLLDLLNTNGLPLLKPELNSLMRIPAIKNKECLLPVSQCRPENLRNVISGVLGIATISVRSSLQDQFGWSAPVQAEMIALRIDNIASSLSGAELETALYFVLDYIHGAIPQEQIGKYISEVKSSISIKEWFPGTQGLLSPDHLFIEDAQDFAPYLDNVSLLFKGKFRHLLTFLGIYQRPSTESLLQIILSFPKHTVLDQRNLDIIINVLERLSDLNGLKQTRFMIPDLECRLRHVEDFKKGRYFGHPRLPRRIALKYNIPQARKDIAFFEHIIAAGDFEDYSQEEQICTRISNTLKDYSLPTAFNEFVANAEDCGSASQIIWLLDERDISFPTKNLFCKELACWQTPSLYIYNDGQFTDEDFKALINIGSGSKANDRSKIGKYGLGSLTMYHFTDVPSMISGEFFVIFDPSRTYLPHNSKGRRQGFRFPLSLMRDQYCDHLVPFVGIGGYTLDSVTFKGTIFRCPLRTKKQIRESPLIPNNQRVEWMDVQAELKRAYLSQGKRSLILLRKIRHIEFQLGDSSGNHRFKTIWRVWSDPGGDWTPEIAEPSTPLEHLKSSKLHIGFYDSQSIPSIGTDNWIIITALIKKEALSKESAQKETGNEWMSRICSSVTKFCNCDSHDTFPDPIIPDIAVAFQLPSTEVTEPCTFYNSLPIPAPTGLPINCHANFATSSDRRSIRVDGENGKWNKFLAEECLPHLYFTLLEKLITHPLYYTFWPTECDDAISHSLRLAFWRKIPQCQKGLISNRNRPPLRISEVIFDNRDLGKRYVLSGDPVARLVRSLRPNSPIVYEPVINKGLADTSMHETKLINVLSPSFVREMVKEPSAEQAVATLDDISLKIVLDFVLEDDSIEQLVGCFLLRTAEGKLTKFDTADGGNIFYAIDQSGFGLFEKVCGDQLVNSTILPSLTNKGNYDAALNIREVSGSEIDRFIEKHLPFQHIRVSLSTEAKWLSEIWKYIVDRDFCVTFHQTRPTLVLASDDLTFVSLEGLQTLPIMPSETPKELRKICHKVPGMLMLAKTQVERVNVMISLWNCEEKFLECLHRVTNGDVNRLQLIVREYLDAPDLSVISLRSVVLLTYVQYLRTLIMRVYHSKASHSAHVLKVLQCLPIWKAIGQANYTAAAADAFFIADAEKVFPDLAPKEEIFIIEDEQVEKVIIGLGAKKLTYRDYLFKIVQGLSNRSIIGRLSDIKELLKEIVDGYHYFDYPKIDMCPIIPDRTGTLRIGSKLYCDRIPIFTQSFMGDDSSFPHPCVELISLRAFNVNTQVTVDCFKSCVRRLESDFLGTCNPETIWNRCCNVWREFGTLNLSWGPNDLNILAKIKFVPLYRSQTYRTKFLERIHGDRIVTTMRDAIALEYLPIAWTQRSVVHSSPPKFAASVGFAPTIENVAEHLVELAINIAAKCKISDRDFFTDLEATYDYLNMPEHQATASKYLLSRHGEKSLWLNEDISLGKISQPDNHSPSSSLKWMKAKSIIHGVPYDLPQSNIYSANTSIDRYGDLLRGCGSLVIQDVKAKLNEENVEGHAYNLLESIRKMIQTSDNLCDLKIIIGGRNIYVHRLVMGAVSSYFRGLACGQWKETSMSELNLDNVEGEKLYGSREVVESVIHWVYNGFLELDDTNLNDEEAVEEQLDHYLDMLILADMWDVPLLRGYIENCLMKQWRKFIRPENVLDIMKIANTYNGAGLVQFCNDYIRQNKRAVDACNN